MGDLAYVADVPSAYVADVPSDARDMADDGAPGPEDYLHITALARQQDGMGAFMLRIAKMLGLGEDADEDAIMAALEKALKGGKGEKPDPREYVPAEAYNEALAMRRSEGGAAHAERARTKVETAMPAPPGHALRCAGAGRGAGPGVLCGRDRRELLKVQAHGHPQDRRHHGRDNACPGAAVGAPR